MWLSLAEAFQACRVNPLQEGHQYAGKIVGQQCPLSGTWILAFPSAPGAMGWGVTVSMAQPVCKGRGCYPVMNHNLRCTGGCCLSV